MPTYDYQCRSCNAVTEVIHSMLEAGPSTCEQCGGQLRRVLYPAGIIFKGSGFYRTDSRAAPASSTTEGGTGKGSAATAASTTSGSTAEAPKPTTDTPST